jgi:PncC family amidohydrolase
MAASSSSIPPDDEQLLQASARLGAALRARGWRLATAESCTGGLIGHEITAIPGASDYYPGGVITYSDLAKEVELAVPRELLQAHGAVSQEVAAAMAVGVRQRFGVEVGMAVTGIAGPWGDTPDKPIGLTYIAVARVGHPPVVVEEVWTFDRDGNKRASALRALELALSVAGDER